MALSELQKKKVTAAFHLFDTSKDGIVESVDFQQFGEKAAELLGATSGSAEYKKVLSGYEGIWTGYFQSADADGDGKVTLEEYFSAVEGFINSKGTDAGLTLNRALFDAIDLDGSGQIDANEYAIYIKSLGGSDADAKTAFSHLDADSSGAISRDEFAKALYDYFTSNDANAPGNWVYGGKF